MSTQWLFPSKFQWFAVFLLLGSCAEQVGTGNSIQMPVVSLNCSTSQCRTNSSPRVFVRITQSSCDPNFDNLALASTSFDTTCRGSSGCAVNTNSATWVNDKGETVTMIKAGSYTVCARLDYNRSYPTTTSDDTTGSLDSVSLTQSKMSLILTSWQDP